MKGQKRNFQFKGKQILLFGLVALVITAGYYRWTIEGEKLSASVTTASEAVPNDEAENGEKTEENAEGKDGYDPTSEIETMRKDRDSARSQSEEEWRKITQSAEASAEAKRDAEKELSASSANADKERKIETMVKAKGYNDCLAYVDEGGVSVTVKGGEIDGAKVAQIKDIIVTETNVSVKNIRINAL